MRSGTLCILCVYLYICISLFQFCSFANMSVFHGLRGYPGVGCVCVFVVGGLTSLDMFVFWPFSASVHCEFSWERNGQSRGESFPLYLNLRGLPGRGSKSGTASGGKTRLGGAERPLLCH